MSQKAYITKITQEREVTNATCSHRGLQYKCNIRKINKNSLYHFIFHTCYTFMTNTTTVVIKNAQKIRLYDTYKNIIRMISIRKNRLDDNHTKKSTRPIRKKLQMYLCDFRVFSYASLLRPSGPRKLESFCRGLLFDSKKIPIIYH